MNELIINGRFLAQRLTGVHRYAYEMTQALHRAGVSFVVVAPPEINHSYQITFPLEQTGRTCSHYWEQVELPLYVRRNHPNATILSFTGLGPVAYSRNVITIHDLSFMANPRWFSIPYYCFYRLLTPFAARRAKKIITVSLFSKQEIISRLGIEANKIFVAYNAVAADCIEPERDSQSPMPDSPYLLAVSSLDPRKNLKRLIKAFHLINIPDCRLLIVGAAHPSFRSLGIADDADERVQFVGYASNDRLRTLYCHALAAVYPSVYEGFGLPNIEAMANGCPVVTSKIPPHIEVCGDAALYFDPLEEEDIAHQLKQIISDANLRKILADAGKERIRHFSWDQSARIIRDELTDNL